MSNPFASKNFQNYFQVQNPQSFSQHSILNKTFIQAPTNIIFTLTGFDTEKKRELLALSLPSPLQQCYSPTLNGNTNLLVCCKVLTEKYVHAVKYNIPIVTPHYLVSSSRAGKWLPLDAYQCPPLYGLKICCTGFSEVQRVILQKKIESAGATFQPAMFRNETTHLIVNVGADQSMKAQAATDWNIKTLREEWVYHSIAENFAQDEDAYIVYTRPQNTSTGVTPSGGTNSTNNMNTMNNTNNLHNTGTSNNPIITNDRNGRDNVNNNNRNTRNQNGNGTRHANHRSAQPSLHNHVSNEDGDSQRKSIGGYNDDSNDMNTRTTLVPFQPISRQISMQDFFLPDQSLFEYCTIYLLGYSTYPAILQKTTQLLLQHGALILPILIPHRVTHVLIYKPTDNEGQLLQNSFILSDISMSVIMHRWVEDCIQENTLLDESEYLYM